MSYPHTNEIHYCRTVLRKMAGHPVILSNDNYDCVEHDIEQRKYEQVIECMV